MTGVALIDWIIGSFVALAGAFGVIAGAMKMFAEGRNLKAAAKTPYNLLNDRVSKLEESDEAKSKEIFRLRSQIYRVVGVVTREVTTLVAWHEGGRTPPAPDQEVAIVRQLIEEIKEDQRSSKL